MKTLKFLTLALFLFAFSRVQPVFAETLKIPGTGACEDLLQALAEAFNQQHPDYSVTIPPSIGSGGGIREVIENKTIFARVSRPLKDEETDYGLSYLAFAKDAVVFAVGEDVKIQGLASSQIADIFEGKIDNWQQAGGADAFIRVLIREPDDSSLNVIKHHINQFQTLKFTEKSKMLFHDCEMRDMLNKYKTSIGWLPLSSITVGKGSSIKPLAIDGIAPTAENMLNSRYKLATTYALVYKANMLNKLTREFIDFLFSEPGRQILVRNGVIPLNRK